MDRYGFFRPYDDNLVVQFGQQLVWLDQSGREERSQDLSALRIHAEGDYDFFSTGELLVDTALSLTGNAKVTFQIVI